MAPELEDYWFEHRGSGWCRSTKAINWKGWLAVALYSATVAVTALFLAERTLLGFFAVLTLLTAGFLILASAKTRGGLLCGRTGRT